MLEIDDKVKKLIESESIRKNIRITVIDGSVPDITNDDVVQSSVQFTESLCSKDEFKFGLCESSMMQFQTSVDVNLKGKEIDVALEVDATALGTVPAGQIFPVYPDYVINDGKNDYPYCRIPYGLFTVTSCSRDYATGLRKVEAMTPRPWDEAYTAMGNAQVFDASPLGVDRKFVFYPRRRWVAGLSPIELNKMYTRSKSRKTYDFDIGCWIASNIPGAGKSMLREFHNMVPHMGTQYIWDNYSRYPIRDANGNVKARLVVRIDYAEYMYSDVFPTSYANALAEQLVYLNSDISNHSYDFFVALKELLEESSVISKDDMRSSRNSEVFADILEKLQKVVYPRYETTGDSADCPLPSNCRVVYPYWNGNSTESGSALDKSWKVYIPRYIETMVYDADGLQIIELKDRMIVQDVSAYYGKCALNQDLDNTYGGFGILKAKRVKPTEKKAKGYIMNAAVLSLIWGLKDELDVRKLDEAALELSAMFSMYDRDTSAYGLMKLEPIMTDGLRPSAWLVPQKDLEPRANGADPTNIYPSQMQSVWTDDEVSKPYGRVIITCTPTDAEKDPDTKELIEEEVVSYINGCTEESWDENEWKQYDLSANLILALFPHKREYYQEIADRIAGSLNGIWFYPYKATVHSLPYLEAGDPVRINTRFGSFASYILKQTIKGISNITQNISAGG